MFYHIKYNKVFGFNVSLKMLNKKNGNTLYNMFQFDYRRIEKHRKGRQLHGPTVRKTTIKIHQDESAERTAGGRDRQQPTHLFQRQQHELLCLGHFHKVLQHVLVRRLEQVAAGVRVCEASDAQAVGGVQLTEEEFAARVPNSVELQQARCWKQGLETRQFTSGKKKKE